MFFSQQWDSRGEEFTAQKNGWDRDHRHILKVPGYVLEPTWTAGYGSSEWRWGHVGYLFVNQHTEVRLNILLLHHKFSLVLFEEAVKVKEEILFPLHPRESLLGLLVGRGSQWEIVFHSRITPVLLRALVKTSGAVMVSCNVAGNILPPSFWKAWNISESHGANRFWLGRMYRSGWKQNLVKVPLRWVESMR